MKALVTGGAGFIGHHLVRALLERGDEVVVIDDLSTGQRDRLVPVEREIDFFVGSILDGSAIDAAAQGCEVIFHEAALPSVARSLADPIASHRVNVEGTIRVMQAAASAGARRVVFAGSSSVYGVPRQLPCVESATPAPESPYGVSKLSAETYVHVLGKHMGIETVALRYFNVFGPGQDPTSEYAAVIPRFVTATLAAESPTINGDGSTSRDFTFISNVVAANLLAAHADASGVTCNIACGDRTTLLELLAATCAAVGRTVEPRFGPPRAGDITHSLADISLARSLLGYEVTVPFARGIELTVDWYRERLQGDLRPAGSH